MIAIAVLGIGSSVCNRKPEQAFLSKQELVGTYVGSEDVGEGQLVLGANDEYRLVVERGDKPKIYRGRWEIHHPCETETTVLLREWCDESHSDCEAGKIAAATPLTVRVLGKWTLLELGPAGFRYVRESGSFVEKASLQ